MASQIKTKKENHQKHLKSSGYVKKSVIRGFKHLKIIDIARDIYQEELLKKYKQNSPNNLKDLFTIHPDPNIVYPDHLQPFIDLLEHVIEGKEKIEHCIAVPSQTGKDLINTTPILTERGWVTVGDVVLGDRLIDDTGNYTNVIGVHPQPLLEQYRITFDDGTHVDCGAEHKWNVKNPWNKKAWKAPWKTKTTAELIKDYKLKDRCKYQIPIVEPINFPEKDLPLNPYLFGCWLGDGYTKANGITTLDVEIYEAFNKQFPINRSIKRTYIGKATSYFFTGLNQSLKKIYNTNVKDRVKYIPNDYLQGSIKQRLAILQGLLDTDGSICKGQITFSNTNENIIEGIKQIVCSLGGVCRERIKEPKKPQHKKAWEVSIRLPEQFTDQYFRLQRKQKLVREFNNRQQPRRFIKHIESIGKHPSTCFSVDSKNKLFCVGKDFHVTHNSTLSMFALAFLCGKQTEKNHLYVTYSRPRAKRVQDQFVALCRQVGLKTYSRDRFVSVVPWGEESYSNTVLFGSPSGGITGEPINGLAIIDDIIKNVEDGTSHAVTTKLWDGLYTEVMSRRPQNVLVFNTRWSTIDIIAKLTNKWNWPYLRIPAICDGPNDPLGRKPGEILQMSEAFGNRRLTEEFLIQDRKRKPLEHAAMYQGLPATDTYKLFGQYVTYTMLPPGEYLTSIGIDLACSTNKNADYSSLSVVKHNLKTGKYYLVDVHLRQCLYLDFIDDIKTYTDKYPGAFVRFDTGGQEEYTSGQQIVAKLNCPVQLVSAKPGNGKVQRARYTSELWNAGNLLIPEQQTAVMKRALAQILTFSGDNKTKDDAVDSLASAVNAIHEQLAQQNYNKLIGTNKQNKSYKTYDSIYNDNIDELEI